MSIISEVIQAATKDEDDSCDRGTEIGVQSPLHDP